MSSKDKIAEYIKKGGVSCMRCSSNSIESYGSYEFIENTVNFYMVCTTCDNE